MEIGKTSCATARSGPIKTDKAQDPLDVSDKLVVSGLLIV